MAAGNTDYEADLKEDLLEGLAAISATPGSIAGPTAGALELQTDTLRHALERWHHHSADPNATHVPSHLYHLLDRQYAQASMSFNALMPNDSAQVLGLLDLTRERPFEILLAALEKKELGDVQPHDPNIYVDYDPECHDISEFEAEEASTLHEMTRVRKVSYTVKALRTLDGTTIASNFPLDTSFCLVDDPFEDMEITEERYRAFKGRRDPTATHFYRLSALVLVPRHRFDLFLSECHEHQASSR
ncbi:hypothetical protein PGT21_019644 [Puccinia graminis f. sp. tritici]|uniref:Uncharacterized protein n=1 Tax=Puccinia graminis f. sp. tritici TaxID=56615 RepID=A0A5B0Q624_PUCGR|nr:hypothetical protein PGT21_019644 [Puccinia graminis f. sp. tritici]